MSSVLCIFALIFAALVIIVVISVLLFLRFSPSVGRMPGAAERSELERRSAHYRNGAFHNENRIRTLSGGKRYSSNRKRPGILIDAVCPSFDTGSQNGEPAFTWLGHSSFVIGIAGKTVAVDPVLGMRSSPAGFIGPKRFSKLPLSAEDFPAADIVFISHDHYDHLDHKTIMAIEPRVGKFVVPLGLDAVLKSWDIPGEKICTLDWWESVEIGGLKVTLTPSQHFSGRNPLKGNSTLWGGLYLSDGRYSVYYTGDGGYYDVFRAVGEKLGAPDLMIAECGQYDPSWAGVHMFPEQTVQAGLDAGASWLIPVHWGSFCICNHAWDDPIRRVTLAAKEAGLSVATPRIGQTVNLGSIDTFTERWWEQITQKGRL
ncbi:MAG: MBL fold metallo-hydrolase [Lachnospiraceae bacterium]|nr:MBL fold metallo-hydrolase [Lachnospiraceae bacterium]